MYPDFKELLSTFNAHNVKYLIVGGYAVGIHAQPRATKDLDLFIRPEIENAEAVYKALAAFGAPLEGLKPEDFLDQNGFFRMGNPPAMIEVLPAIKGVDFDAAWERRVEDIIDPASGLKAYYISSQDLITNKLAFGRPQDLADVDAIRKAAEAGKKN
jgi:hypothetical protein